MPAWLPPSLLSSLGSSESSVTLPSTSPLHPRILPPPAPSRRSNTLENLDADGVYTASPTNTGLFALLVHACREPRTSRHTTDAHTFVAQMLVTTQLKTFFHCYLSLRPTELPLPLRLPPSIRMRLPKGGHNPLPGAPPHAQPGPAEWASLPLDRWPQRARQPSGTLAVRTCATANSQCGMWASETTYQQGGNRVADGGPSLPARPALMDHFTSSLC